MTLLVQFGIWLQVRQTIGAQFKIMNKTEQFIFNIQYDWALKIQL